MRAAAFIPIKSYSERVPHKNMRLFDGRPLFQWIIDHAQEAGCFSDVFVDTDCMTVADYATEQNCLVIRRLPELATNTANGNDLLKYHLSIRPDYDAYFQLFATAPRLSPATIAACVKALRDNPENDSILTVTQEVGWYWFAGMPVNFRPGILPRSQDARCVVKETTGLYGIRRDSLARYGCRIGANPLMWEVDKEEAVDIDYDRDFISASPTR